jgi:hypothetical protein
MKTLSEIQNKHLRRTALCAYTLGMAVALLVVFCAELIWSTAQHLYHTAVKQYQDYSERTRLLLEDLSEYW